MRTISSVVEIVSAAEYLIANPDIKHGKVVFGFGPDEEIGIGADNFHVAEFGADFAYTVDGGPLGELEWETFSAAAATIKIQGQRTPWFSHGHDGQCVASCHGFARSLPVGDRPELTEGRQGFFHILKLTGTPEEAEMAYIIRDHDRVIFEQRKQILRDIVEKMNGEFGLERIKLEMNDQYYNMGEILKDDMTPVDLAEAAMKALDIKPVIEPVRGGTDGSKITFLGLLTPNLFAGGENMHGRYEYVSTKVMNQAVDTILKIIELNNK